MIEEQRFTYFVRLEITFPSIGMVVFFYSLQKRYSLQKKISEAFNNVY